jgi:hypothetical protein
MAIAIRIDASATSLKSLVDSYTKEGRPAIRMTCPEAKCGQEYVIYHGPSMDEMKLRNGFTPYLKRDHPKHPVIYEIDEQMSRDLKNVKRS